MAMTEKKKNKLKTWLMIGAIALCVIMLIGVFVKLGNMETTRKLNTSNYAVGTISATDGKINESRQNIYTKDLLNAEDIEITLNEDATITYKVFCYDEDKEFISATNSLSADFDAQDLAQGTAYVRVVITPAQVDGENVNINAFNMAKYTSQINIVVQKTASTNSSAK